MVVTLTVGLAGALPFVELLRTLLIQLRINWVIRHLSVLTSKVF
jgi:hypothetical protein